MALRWKITFISRTIRRNLGGISVDIDDKLDWEIHKSMT